MEFLGARITGPKGEDVKLNVVTDGCLDVGVEPAQRSAGRKVSVEESVKKWLKEHAGKGGAELAEMTGNWMLVVGRSKVLEFMLRIWIGSGLVILKKIEVLPHIFWSKFIRSYGESWTVNKILSMPIHFLHLRPNISSQRHKQTIQSPYNAVQPPKFILLWNRRRREFYLDPQSP
jgi:hypothetical protein